MTKMLEEMKMMMSDARDHCWTFVVIDDKGGERLIKASGFRIFVSFDLSLYLMICNAGCSFCFLSFIDVSWF